MMPEATTGKETVVRTGTVLPANVKDSPALVRRDSQFDAFLRDRQAADGDPERDPYEAILQQVMNADSPDAVLTPVEALEGRNLIGEPLILLGFELNKSDYDQGSPFYASMHVLRPPDGEQAVVNCGHKKVLAQLVKLQEFHDNAKVDAGYPYQVMFRTRGVSKVGGTPMLELTKWTEQPEEPPF